MFYFNKLITEKKLYYLNFIVHHLKEQKLYLKENGHSLNFKTSQSQRLAKKT